MNSSDKQFQERLLLTFKAEATEHLGTITSGLVECEKAPAEKQNEFIETIFRETHSLKGAANSVNAAEVVMLCQSMENVFAAMKRKELAVSPPLFDLLHQTADAISRLISAKTEPGAEEKSGHRELIRRLGSASKGSLSGEHEPAGATVSSGVSPPPSTDTEAAETVRISAEKLKALLFQAEDLLTAKQAARQRAAELQEISPYISIWEKEWAQVHPEVQKLQQYLVQENRPESDFEISSRLKRIVKFTNRNYDYIKSLGNRMTMLARNAERDNQSLDGMVNNLLEDMKKVLMLPVASFLSFFPRYIRDFSRDQGKKVDLVIRGGDVEIDRRILDEMKNPLVHLVRNCIDHGIEKPEEREQKNKPAFGKITIDVAHKDRGHVEISVSDDGKGIDVSRVKSAAVKLGIVSQQEAEKLNDRETALLVFHSGMSTSSMITDVSGRGLGLAIVREKVEKLGGDILIHTTPGAGTSFRIVLRSTLANFMGILVKVGKQLFVIPVANIERVARIRKDDIKTVENVETIRLDGKAVSLVHLGDVLELPGEGREFESSEFVQTVVLGTGQEKIAFIVDEVLDEQEILVKNLSANLSRVRNVSGATVLETGAVVPVLNIPDVMKSAVRAERFVYRGRTVPEEDEAERKSILVVEDSITARSLLINILETGGYDVEAAVDGVNAFEKLKNGEFDLVVSDVDMPRMNGFDLTARIRKDKDLAGLPIVLVTSLDSREDRERGIEVGANAYIVKSSFDQNDLLGVVRRLT